MAGREELALRRLLRLLEERRRREEAQARAREVWDLQRRTGA